MYPKKIIISNADNLNHYKVHQVKTMHRREIVEAKKISSNQTKEKIIGIV